LRSSSREWTVYRRNRVRKLVRRHVVCTQAFTRPTGPKRITQVWWATRTPGSRTNTVRVVFVGVQRWTF
jgi:hypothetical protein